jgi:hypothetical protein
MAQLFGGTEKTGETPVPLLLLLDGQSADYTDYADFFGYILKNFGGEFPVWDAFITYNI